MSLFLLIVAGLCQLSLFSVAMLCHCCEVVCVCIEDGFCIKISQIYRLLVLTYSFLFNSITSTVHIGTQHVVFWNELGHFLSYPPDEGFYAIVTVKLYGIRFSIENDQFFVKPIILVHELSDICV